MSKQSFRSSSARFRLILAAENVEAALFKQHSDFGIKLLAGIDQHRRPTGRRATVVAIRRRLAIQLDSRTQRTAIPATSRQQQPRLRVK